MIFLSEVFWMLKLIKNKDALQKHDDTLFDAEAFVSQWNFGYDYLTNISSYTIPDMPVADTTFSWKIEIVSESCEAKCGYFKVVRALSSVKHVSMLWDLRHDLVLLLIWNWAVRPELQLTLARGDTGKLKKKLRILKLWEAVFLAFLAFWKPLQATPPPVELRFMNSELIVTASLWHQHVWVWRQWQQRARGAGQSKIRVPLAGSSLSSKPCSCHLGQGGSTGPVPSISILILKVERGFLHLTAEQNHETLRLLCLVGSQQHLRPRGRGGAPPGHPAGGTPWEQVFSGNKHGKSDWNPCHSTNASTCGLAKCSLFIWASVPLKQSEGQEQCITLTHRRNYKRMILDITVLLVRQAHHLPLHAIFYVIVF